MKNRDRNQRMVPGFVADAALATKAQAPSPATRKTTALNLSRPCHEECYDFFVACYCPII